MTFPAPGELTIQVCMQLIANVIKRLFLCRALCQPHPSNALSEGILTTLHCDYPHFILEGNKAQRC